MYMYMYMLYVLQLVLQRFSLYKPIYNSMWAWCGLECAHRYTSICTYPERNKALLWCSLWRSRLRGMEDWCRLVLTCTTCTCTCLVNAVHVWYCYSRRQAMYMYKLVHVRMPLYRSNCPWNTNIAVASSPLCKCMFWPLTRVPRSHLAIMHAYWGWSWCSNKWKSAS